MKILGFLKPDRNASGHLPAFQCRSIRVMVPAQSSHTQMVIPYNTISSYSCMGGAPSRQLWLLLILGNIIELFIRDPNLCSMNTMNTVDGSAFYRSIDLFDQHRNMRMNMDNICYVRIGNASTVLSEVTASRCMMETAYLFSHQIQEEGNYYICRKSIRRGRNGEDFHVSCMWKPIKNGCPVCNDSAFIGP
ncbi:unnamed protein product [Musa hybrid cultivar]